MPSFKFILINVMIFHQIILEEKKCELQDIRFRSWVFHEMVEVPSGRKLTFNGTEYECNNGQFIERIDAREQLFPFFPALQIAKHGVPCSVGNGRIVRMMDYILGQKGDLKFIIGCNWNEKILFYNMITFEPILGVVALGNIEYNCQTDYLLADLGKNIDISEPKVLSCKKGLILDYSVFAALNTYIYLDKQIFHCREGQILVGQGNGMHILVSRVACVETDRKNMFDVGEVTFAHRITPTKEGVYSLKELRLDDRIKRPHFLEDSESPSFLFNTCAYAEDLHLPYGASTKSEYTPLIDNEQDLNGTCGFIWKKTFKTNCNFSDAIVTFKDNEGKTIGDLYRYCTGKNYVPPLPTPEGEEENASEPDPSEREPEAPDREKVNSPGNEAVVGKSNSKNFLINLSIIGVSLILGVVLAIIEFMLNL